MVLTKGPFNGTYAEFPFDSEKEFGTKKHVWCKISVEGRTYSKNLLPNGQGGHWLHLKKEMLGAIGKSDGDTVYIQLEKDDTPRTIIIPDYLQCLLDNDPQSAKYFDKMTISAKIFWIDFMQEPKSDDAKVKRVNRFFEHLHEQFAGKD